MGTNIAKDIRGRPSMRIDVLLVRGMHSAPAWEVKLGERSLGSTEPKEGL